MRIKNFWSYQGKFLLVKKKWLTTWMARWHVCRKEEYWTTCWWSGKPLREVPFPSLARWTWIHCRCPRQVGTPLRQHYLRLCIIKNVTKELKKEWELIHNLLRVAFYKCSIAAKFNARQANEPVGRRNNLCQDRNLQEHKIRLIFMWSWYP